MLALARAIIKTCDQVRRGRFDGQFVVDAYQAGAGTSFNMNVNEVIANRSLELLGRRRGGYAAAVHASKKMSWSAAPDC